MIPCRPLLAALVALLLSVCARAGDAELRKAVTLYASFDDEVRGDFGGGALELSTRFNHPTKKGQANKKEQANNELGDPHAMVSTLWRLAG